MAKTTVSLVFFLTVEDVETGLGLASSEKSVPLELNEEQQATLVSLVRDVLIDNPEGAKDADV